jgi:protein kinase D
MGLLIQLYYFFNLFFVFIQIPENGLNHLADRLLLFRHDYNSNNVLQIINSASEITDETLVEIVLTANREYYIFIYEVQ